MKVTRKTLKNAVVQGIISDSQAETLWEYWTDNASQEPYFNFTNVLYYAGGLLAIGAMTLFMGLGWESFGGWGIFFISLLYGGVALKLSKYFSGKGYLIPAGICATFVVAITPLAIYGFQQAIGFWPDDTGYRDYHRYIKWHWIYLELGTLAVGAILAWLYRYPFSLMPVAVTLWYLSMDLTSMLTGGDFDWELRRLISCYFGLAFIVLAIWVDTRSRKSEDFAYWLYIFGVITFWSSLSLMESSTELGKFFYFCINIAMVLIGVVLSRGVFAVFGSLGICIYVGDLAWRVFQDSWMFPIVLTLIGFMIIYLGILWKKNEKYITSKAQLLLPTPLKELLENRRH